MHTGAPHSLFSFEVCVPANPWTCSPCAVASVASAVVAAVAAGVAPAWPVAVASIGCSKIDGSWAYQRWAAAVSGTSPRWTSVRRWALACSCVPGRAQRVGGVAVMCVRNT